MLPRNNPNNPIRKRIISALEQQPGLSKHDLEAVCFVSATNCRRYLYELHKEAAVYISGWEARHGEPTPCWTLGSGCDAPKPTPVPKYLKQRKYREKEGVREAEASRKRAKRRMRKVQQAPSLVAAILGV